jgi:hypothetical protein
LECCKTARWKRREMKRGAGVCVVDWRANIANTEQANPCCEDETQWDYVTVINRLDGV